jgi:hypothetical protein
VSSTTESLLNINAPCEESSVPALGPRKPKSPTQLGYKELRERVRFLEGDNLQLAGRNQFLEERHALDRDSLEVLSSKLAAYDKAEATLATAVEAQLKQAYAQFDGRAVPTRQRFPDFDQSLEELHKFLRTELIRTLLEWESGPFALYALAKNPSFCQSLQSLSLAVASERIFKFVLHVEKNFLSSSITQTYLQLAKPAKEHHVRS